MVQEKKKSASNVKKGEVSIVQISNKQAISNEGYFGLDLLCCPKGNVDKSLSFKRLDLPNGRENHTLHAKFMCGYNTITKERLYFYTGSHNCSKNAWGYYRL